MEREPLPPPPPHSTVSKTIYAGLTKGGRYLDKGVYGPPGINQVSLSPLNRIQIYVSNPPPPRPSPFRGGEFAVEENC